jgi:hypothetical protein
MNPMVQAFVKRRLSLSVVQPMLIPSRDFDLGSLVASSQVSEVVADDRASPTDKHTHKIAAHVSAYIHHVRTQLKQTIPKAIVHCLVRALLPPYPPLHARICMPARACLAVGVMLVPCPTVLCRPCNTLCTPVSIMQSHVSCEQDHASQQLRTRGAGWLLW